MAEPTHAADDIDDYDVVSAARRAEPSFLPPLAQLPHLFGARERQAAARQRAPGPGDGASEIVNGGCLFTVSQGASSSSKAAGRIRNGKPALRARNSLSTRPFPVRGCPMSKINERSSAFGQS
jgi:hypothetical protein